MNLEQYKVMPQDKENKGVVSAPNRPSGTPRQNKMLFDNLTGFFIDKYNGLLAAIQSTFTAQESTNSDVVKKVTQAVETSARAEETAKKAESNINFAVNTAENALKVANGIAGTAQTALDTSALAQKEASAAKATAGLAEAAAVNALKIASAIAATAENAFFTASEAKAIAQSAAIVIDPTTGYKSPIQTVLENIFYATVSPITAAEFDALNITAAVFDALNLSAYEFDTRGKSILTGG